MKIYTGRGDEGKTDLWHSSDRVSKTNPRIGAYGAVDEVIGLLGHAAGHCSAEVKQELEQVQHQLHILMAQLADKEEQGDKRIEEHHITELEDKIDAYNAELDDLDAFILPSGSDGGSLLHYARSVCRRAERRIVMLAEMEGVDEHVLCYINRLSDFLFTLGRYQNTIDGAEERTVDYDR
jgi:cob(I)alamin adenosyltransferase